jgi:hypothetical protein
MGREVNQPCLGVGLVLRAGDTKDAGGVEDFGQGHACRCGRKAARRPRSIDTIRRDQPLEVHDFRVDFLSPPFEGSLQAMERFATEVRPKVVT